MKATRFFFLVGGLALGLALAACTDMETNPDNNASVTTLAPNLVSQAPPEAPYEAVPPLDNPQTQIWRPGHWDNNGSGFTWIAGEVMVRPSPTAVWSPDIWVRHEYGWGFVCGHWE